MFILPTILACATAGSQLGALVGGAVEVIVGIEGAAATGAAMGTIAGTATGIGMVIEGERIPITVPTPVQEQIQWD